MAHHDARLDAWLCAWNRLESAHKVYREHIQTADAYHQTLLDEAKIYSDLANAPEVIGISAGEFLAAEDRRRSEILEAVRRVR